MGTTLFAEKPVHVVIFKNFIDLLLLTFKNNLRINRRKFVSKAVNDNKL